MPRAKLRTEELADVLLAMLQGLMREERAGFLGTSQASIHRRWELGIRAAIDGLKP